MKKSKIKKLVNKIKESHHESSLKERDWAGFIPPSGYVGDDDPQVATIVQILNNHESFGNQYPVRERPDIGGDSDNTIAVETKMPSQYAETILSDPHFNSMGVSWKDYYEDVRVIDGGPAGTIIVFSRKQLEETIKEEISKYVGVRKKI